MNAQLENLALALSGAGCGPEAVERAERLLEAGCAEDLLRYLRLCRCGLMDDLHERQRRVDRMDTLIRQTEKAIGMKQRKEGR